jgi:hypothetical protein
MIRTLSLAVAIALFLCGGAARSQDGPTTPSGAGTSGSPNDECRPPRQSIAPFEPRGGLMMTAEVTVSPDGDMSVAVADPMTATLPGLLGVARLYAAHTARYTNTPETLASVIGELDSFVPFPGRSLLIPIVGDDPAPPGCGGGGGPNDPPTDDPCPSGTDHDLPCQWMLRRRRGERRDVEGVEVHL